jgi:preprotein translocase subunit SecG
MQAFLTVAIIIVCVLLILVVLIQNSKGGGISSNFTAANQIMGARRGTDFIEKTTWTLAILLLVMSLLSTPKKGSAGDTDTTTSVTQDKLQELGGAQPAAPAQQPAAQPAAPTPTPAP